jgi:general secretion pathway protein A
MYTAHFGLREPPFSITPDPRYLYMSEGHREALAHLLYGIGEGGGFVQLTGEVGTGKTTLCRCLLEQLPPHVDVAFLLNPKLTDVELLASICDELRVAYPAGTSSRKVLVDALSQYLLDAHGRGHRTVLIIDEAQDLAPEVLEQVRLLTNLETPTEKLLQIILIGQPELIKVLDREDLRQLAQRVTARYHLRPFGEEDTCAYIQHRMEVAGQSEQIFTHRAMRQVHRVARGIPRLVNAVCDRALLGAYSQDERRVGTRTIRRAAREVLGRPSRPPLGRPWQWAAAATLGLILTGAWVVISPGQLSLAPGDNPSRPSATSGAPLAPAAREERATLPTRASSLPLAARAAGIPAGAREAPALGHLLSDPSLRADKRSAFASLYALWRLDYDASRSSLGCDRGRAEGLQCLFKSGTWARLRRFDLPAIIELATPAGDLRYATVVAAGDETATLDVGGRRVTLPLGDIDTYWGGTFILLWKAPGVSSLPIVPGARGKDVEWLRERMREIDGVPARARARDLFDEELRARVMAFQRSRALVADGIVGEETVTHLSSAQRDPAAPRLSRSGS